MKYDDGIYFDGKTGKYYIEPLEFTNGKPIVPIEITETNGLINPISFIPTKTHTANGDVVFYPNQMLLPEERAFYAQKINYALTTQPQIQLACVKAGFMWEDERLKWYSVDGQSVTVGNFSIFIDKIVKEIEPEDEKGNSVSKSIIHVKVQLSRGRIFRGTVPSTNFSDFSWLKNLTEGLASLEAGAKAKEYFTK